MRALFLILIMLFTTLNLHAKYNPYRLNDVVNSLKHLTKSQKRVIRDIKRYAPRGKRDLLLAIAFQESSFGLFKVLRDKRDWRKSSYGYFHATLKTTKWNLKKRGVKVSYRQVKRLLLHNMRFNIQQVKINLRTWERYIKKKRGYIRIKDVLACYNGGYKGYKRKTPRRYARLVMVKLKAIKIAMKRGYI